ncbi:Pterin-binding family [Richelia intracellularis HH01]|jgi:dihydropteroate synthase|uniref:Pterin-binding family n=1 Tax=Richelia intracellularis HH01 TaxID=1165094 RepID=M1X0L3_9NOST|nr:DUF4346 domain-containing protein [Richelia intracellularis]CCH68352.1 Pterin-binding family [Richelia intracellularis HH01]
MDLTIENLVKIDNSLSQRHIDLDPAGYFIIYLDRAANLICAKHFTNIINESGLAVDPETGRVIPARGKLNRTHTNFFSGRTAKEICVELFEKAYPQPLTMLSHAAYLGREFTRAEAALVAGREYVQD